jgi:hypothetical protein
MTKWYAPPIMKYILSVMAHDPSRTIRRHVARNACQSLALLVQMGEMKFNSKDSESLLIEEDGSIPEKNKEPRRSEMETMIKALRKDKEVGKNEVFRELMMPLALCVRRLPLLLLLKLWFSVLLMSIMKSDGVFSSWQIFLSGLLKRLRQPFGSIFPSLQSPNFRPLFPANHDH